VTERRAHAQHELGEVERLAQVVVRAEAEAGHPVAWLPGCGEHEDHGPVLTVGDHLAQRVAVNAGQVPVEHDDIVGTEVELGGRLQPVVGHVHRHALIAQALDQDLGQRPGVLDDQHSHAGTPAFGAGGRAAADGSWTQMRSPPSSLA